MLSGLKTDLSQRVADQIQSAFGVDHDPIVEVPPRRELGDLAFPAPLHLARELRRSPREIATELKDGLVLPSYVRKITVEGAGYLNLFLDRSAVSSQLMTSPLLAEEREESRKIVVEHTNINPNKAAHIGHLRNAVLGDTLGRVLKSLGDRVEIQNYIDDTGVQLADVVVGFLDLRQLSLVEVTQLPEPFDYYCWDLYSEVGQWYEEEPERQELRRRTLHQLESGEGERAEMGRLISRRVVQCHLSTMARLDVRYDLLTHEGAILDLDFFSRAFELLKNEKAIYLEEEGKNTGCWVMPLAGSEEFAGLEDPDKVIVRSDGTVTYVGKDIAYQLWKFGLLGKDFEYRLWDEENVWETTVNGVAEHPAFGNADQVINVIDARQGYLQKIVKAGLEALHHPAQAEQSIHFAYEMVTLSPSTARTLGYLEKDDADDARSLDMSGRKGIGVKADDLMDELEAKSRDEIASRNRDMPQEELELLARQITIAALRFFMVKATTNRVIAFDLDEALNFEGDSGPYLQYSAVRALNIRRRLQEADLPDEVTPETLANLPEEVWADDLWDLILSVALIPQKVEMAGESHELSILARHSLDLAQKFHAIYHRHPILHESHEDLRNARLATTLIFVRGLRALAELLGIPLPSKM